MLAQVEIPTVGTPYRLANSMEDVVFHGLTFLRSSFAIDTLEDASTMSLVRVRATFENVSRAFQSLCETYWAWDQLWTARIWYPVDLSQPDEMPFGAAEVFSVVQVRTDLVGATVDLMAAGITLTGTLPKRRYSATSGFGGIPRRMS